MNEGAGDDGILETGIARFLGGRRRRGPTMDETWKSVLVRRFAAFSGGLTLGARAPTSLWRGVRTRFAPENRNR